MLVIRNENDWSTVPPGEIALCEYAAGCSACEGQGITTKWTGQVIMANLTARGFPRGWWSCSGPGTARHWERGAIKPRYESTGSAKP